MTHLSDFSYLERCTAWVYLFVYLMYSIYTGDKFRCLKYKSIVSGELKSIVTILLMLILIMQSLYDVTSTYVKYNEGFLAVSENQIITKPFSYWDDDNKHLITAMDYVECVTFSLQTGILFLLQTFWNYLSNTFAKKSFMGSLEFKFYIFWALGSMAMFPILQWFFRNDPTKREGVPQLVYGIEALIAALLGIRSHYRFRNIIRLSEKNNGKSNQAIVTRLSYFQDMNLMITFSLFFYASSFIILCSDGLTEKKVINSNKFATDTIIANANVCTVLIILLFISIFHPRPQYSRTITGASTHDESNIGSVKPTPGRFNNFANKEGPVTQKPMIDTKQLGSQPTGNGGFIRAMSPVTVDYISQSNDTTPLTSSAAAIGASNRPLSPPSKIRTFQNATQNIAVQDPYNNEDVMFSIMESSKPKPRYGTPVSQDRYTGSLSSPQRSQFKDGSVYTDMSSGYDQPISPTRNVRSPWDRKQSNVSQADQEEQTVQDWLMKSPNRRNT